MHVCFVVMQDYNTYMRSYNTVIRDGAKVHVLKRDHLRVWVAIDAKLLQNKLMNTFEDYIKDVTGEKSLNAIERKTGIARATLIRKLKGVPPIETVVAIVRAYGLNFAEVFVNAGYIRQDEADSLANENALRKVTDRQLAEEILRRAIESEDSELRQPLRILDEDPDYSQMSDDDVRKNRYGLAAKEADPNIGFDDLPHEP